MTKIRKRLTKEEAISLGFTPKENEKERKKARYYLTQNQWEAITRCKNIGVINSCDKLEVDPTTVKHLWKKTSNESVFVKNPLYEEPTEQEKAERFAVVIDELKKELPKETPVKKPTFKNNSLCNQYVITDYHLGMMSWGEETGDDWDLSIAKKVLIDFFKTAIEQSPKADEAILAQIGDFLHWDGLEAVTPANKHVLDADTRFTKLIRTAIKLIRQVINMLLKKYSKVTLILAEGNHDPASSAWLREVFYAFYEDEKRLVVDTNPDPYYCVTFGDVCLFYHHGHKRKINNIDTSFVSKFKKEFGNSKYVYAHTGHLHHQHTIESNLMILEQHRTLAGKDAYASRGGWLSGRDSKVITYHKKHGEVARQTININMLK
ncbi:MAG TPA: winged helix-turn-helix domain-containing protein [Aequorivita sp.]|nr:winged helix-turn-helix domain-containing protein [Aequorivita sp.]|tara:strand:- start:2671 stop:3801 length:1131 start_codon:yes stop_codon:yes gene_type:complete